MSKAVIFFADGMEECEALNIVDILRRADICVTTVSIMDTKTIKTSSNIVLEADALADDVDYNDFDMLILPGGMPGTKYLSESEIVRKQCLSFSDKYLAAICAAPSVLGELGLLDGRNATCYPGFEDKLKGANVINSGLVDGGNIITARALGSAIPFALKLVEKLEGKQASDNVKNSIYY